MVGPALVLRLEDAAGVVPGGQKGRKSAPPHRAARLERRAAVGDGDGLAVDDLADGAVVADEEAALGEVRDRDRERKGWDGWLRRGGCRWRGDALGQPADRGAELLGQVAIRDDAVGGI